MFGGTHCRGGTESTGGIGRTVASAAIGACEYWNMRRRQRCELGGRHAGNRHRDVGRRNAGVGLAGMTLETIVDVQAAVQGCNAGSQERPGFRGRIISMANPAVDQGGNRRNVIGGLSGDKASADLDAAAMTGLASRDSHLRVIESRWRPTRCRRADAGGMAVLAESRGGHVVALLADCFRTIVAAHAITGDAGMVEGGAQPIVREMAVTALQIGDDMSRGFAYGLHAVMADDAKSRDRQRNLRVINGFRWVPTQHRMAGFAFLAGDRMGRALALRNRSIVAADAASHHLRMIEVHAGAKARGVVARGAVVGTRNVRRQLRRRIESRAGYMANAAIARGSLEDCIDVAGFASQIPVNAIQFESRRQMIERHRDGRRGRLERSDRAARKSCKPKQGKRKMPGCAPQSRSRMLTNGIHESLHPCVFP